MMFGLNIFSQVLGYILWCVSLYVSKKLLAMIVFFYDSTGSFWRSEKDI